jgi:AraC family transcriptional activator of mtrCDE
VHGQTPRRYLVEVRLRRAAARLRATADRVEQIAADMGYPSSTRFGKSFRQLYGLTPLQYRAAAVPPVPAVHRPPGRG